MMQAVGDLLFFAIIGVALAIAAWVLVMIVVPMYPASQASLAKSESAARLAVAALSNALPGQPARIDRRLGDNLYLYVNGGAFDEIPYANLKDAVEKIGRAWCDNVEYPWLATVGVYDIRSGKRLATHGCAFGKLKEAFLKPSSR